jgi:2-polyprenyl-6-hydroxyphenyl methylase/3-demethylubiquinone-9 3-methyltransferase
MGAPSTIDPAEVEYYRQLADQWWDESGKFWPLHRLNRLRSGYLRQRICRHFGRNPEADAPLAGLSVIDIGCGGGILSESMAALGASVTGIDVVPRSLQIARLHAASRPFDIDYREMTVEDMVNTGQRYDVVLNMEVVEHVLELPTFMKDCTQLLHPGGILFVATINRNFLSWLFAIVGAEYILGWLPKGTHRWSKFVRPGELGEMLAESGLRIDAITGVKINPLTKGFSLTPSPRVNYMLSATFDDASG